MTPDQERRTTTRYLLVKALPVGAALLLWAVAAPSDAGSGWFLLFPPSTGDSGHLIFDASAPLPLWKPAHRSDGTNIIYATEYLCQMVRRDMMTQSQRHIGIDDTDIKPEIARIAPGIGKKLSDTMAEAFAFDSAAQCLSSDDPRLVSTPTPAPMKSDANAGKFGLKITIPIPESDRDRASDLTWDMGIIRYTPGRPIVAVVRLNGRSSARLILDTGADGSMVKPELLAAAGVDLARPAGRVKMSGVTGKVEVSYFPVDFEVAGHRARVLRVAAFNDENDIADGLLGRDFLDRFKVVLDPASGTVTLTPK